MISKIGVIKNKMGSKMSRKFEQKRKAGKKKTNLVKAYIGVRSFPQVFEEKKINANTFL